MVHIFIGLVISNSHAQPSNPGEPTHSLIWVDQIRVTVNANTTLTHIGPNTWSSGASSSNLLSENEDGFLEFTANTGSAQYIIGFSIINGSYGGDTYTNAIRIGSKGALYTYEGSTLTTVGTWAAGDIFKLSREGSQVKYYQNGQEIRSVACNTDLRLRIKTSQYNGTGPVIGASFEPKLIVRNKITGTGRANNSGNIELTVSGGTPPYTYNWSSGETTNVISNKPRGTYTVTITDVDGWEQTQTYSLQYKPYWIDLTEVNNEDGVLSKPGESGWHTGANSSNVIPANANGYVEFTANTTGIYVIGLSPNINGFNYTSIVNSLYFNTSAGVLRVYENGSLVTTLGNWQPGDVYRVAREGSEIKYYRNGVVIRSIATNPAFELLSRVVLHSGTAPSLTTSMDAQIRLEASSTGINETSGSGNLSVIASGGSPEYHYTWTNSNGTNVIAEGTSTISNQPRGEYRVSATDAEGRVISKNVKLDYQVYWTDPVLVTENNGILSRTGAAAWNAGANSLNILPPNTNGWIEFVTPKTGVFEIGFATHLTGFGSGNFHNGIYIDQIAGTLRIYESTSMTSLGNSLVGDVMRISREGNTVNYLRNGVIIRSVAVDPNLELKVKAAVNSGNAPFIQCSFDKQFFVLASIDGTESADGTGNITLNPVGGTAPFNYTWVPVNQGASLTNKNRGEYEVTVTDAKNRTFSRKYNLGYKSNWTGHINATESNGILTRIGALSWNAGAVSTASLNANQNGWIEFVAGAPNNYIIGFTTNTTSVNYNTFTHGIRIDVSGVFIIYEVSNDPAFGLWKKGDVFRVSREGSLMKYYKNGTMIRSVAVNANINLRAKASIHLGAAPLVNTSFWLPAIQGNVPDQQEFNALKDLYTATGGATWTDKSNWPATWPAQATSEQFSTWFGVTVTEGDVTAILLPRNNLIGSIPPSIGSLTKLRVLNLDDNWQISGAIPATIGSLTSLQELHLRTSLSGSIPTSIGNLVKLKIMNITSETLTGNIPPSIGNLTDLERLNLYGNTLTGPIPEQIGNLLKLTYLNLSHNQLAGSIPATIGNLQLLQELYLNVNQLGPVMPAELRNLTQLRHLNLNGNPITSAIPGSFQNLTHLTTLDLGECAISGTIPAELGRLSSLQKLILFGNQLTGSIPPLLGNLNNLTDLDLSFNKLTGDLPNEIGNLVQLKYLILGGNQLTGLIPSALSSMVNLRGVYLAGNQLSGSIPLLNNSSGLELMDVSGNMFIGMADFKLHPNRANLTLRVSSNNISFASLEVNFTSNGVHPFKQFNYVPQNFSQKIIPVQVAPGQTLEITAHEPGQFSVITWEKLNNGTWTDVTASSEDPTKRIFRISNAPATVVGQYRWRMTSTRVPNITLESPAIEVISVDPIPSQNTTKGLFNGLISALHWRTDEAYQTGTGDYHGMYLYTYDEKYQLKEANWVNPLNLSERSNKFRVTGMAYDPNGNISALRRYNEQGMRIHNFSYQYVIPAIGVQQTNQLISIPGYSSYQYNKLGQMTSEDKVEGDDQFVEYDVSGKVVKVFSAATKQAADLKVEFQYDDRGFRLAKIDYKDNKTMWYIRDASGNVLSIYEQEGVPAENSTSILVQKEVLIYGAGKVGTYYPQEEGSVNYEITDHLGNVRAVVRDNINTLMATLEDNNQADITNPRVEELAYFENLFETEQTDAFMNVTEPIPTVIDNPDKVAYLRWNDNAGTKAADKAIGPAISMKVRAGDKFNIESWTRYEDRLSFVKDFELVALSSLLGNTFQTMPGFEGVAPSQAAADIYEGLNAAGYARDEEDNSRPFAFMNYILYDANMAMQDAGWVRVPEEAGSDQSALYLPENKPVHIQFDEPINVANDGYIYVWVSNQSKDTRVWFDNLRITHTGVVVAQATDYGPWGDVIREQKADEREYRFGYQGQFAEKDDETGWNHFELREYDAVIGRWTTVDPKRIGWSPYIGMFNNPISGIDPDGGGPGDDMDMAYADAMHQMDMNFYDEMAHSTFLNEVTVSPWLPSALDLHILIARMQLNLPDAISISQNWTAAQAGIGLNATPIGYVKALTGPDAGKGNHFGDASVSIGRNISISAVFTEYYYIGPGVLLLKDFPGPQLSAGFDISPGLLEAGIGGSISETEDGGYIVGKEHSYSVSPEPTPHSGWNINFGGQWFYRDR